MRHTFIKVSNMYVCLTGQIICIARVRRNIFNHLVLEDNALATLHTWMITTSQYFLHDINMIRLQRACMQCLLEAGRQSHSMLGVCLFTHLLWIQRFKEMPANKSTGATPTREETRQKRWQAVGGRLEYSFILISAPQLCNLTLQTRAQI